MWFQVLTFNLQLYLIELLGLLIGLGLFELQHLIYPRMSTGFGMLVIFTNLIKLEIQVTYINLFRLFSVMDGFEQFCVRSHRKNTQLMLVFIKAPFLCLRICYCILMTPLVMLSVSLLANTIVVEVLVDLNAKKLSLFGVIGPIALLAIEA